MPTKKKNVFMVVVVPDELEISAKQKESLKKAFKSDVVRTFSKEEVEVCSEYQSPVTECDDPKPRRKR